MHSHIYDPSSIQTLLDQPTSEDNTDAVINNLYCGGLGISPENFVIVPVHMFNSSGVLWGKEDGMVRQAAQLVGYIRLKISIYVSYRERKLTQYTASPFHHKNVLISSLQLHN